MSVGHTSVGGGGFHEINRVKKGHIQMRGLYYQCHSFLESSVLIIAEDVSGNGYNLSAYMRKLKITGNSIFYTYIYIYLYLYIYTYIFEVILTVHRRHYVEIKCQLDATDDFYCRFYCMLNMFRAILCPLSGAREYYTEL